MFPEIYISEYILFVDLGQFALNLRVPWKCNVQQKQDLIKTSGLYSQFQNKSKDNRGPDTPIEVREAYNGGNLSWNIISRRDRESLVPPILLNIVRLA